MAVPMETFCKVGPSGGVRGQSWTLGPFDSSFLLLRIKVWHDDVIHGIQFKYERNGVEQWGLAYGVIKGRCEKIVLDHQLELAELEVSVDGEHQTLTSLSFITKNARTFGPYGLGKENKYSISVSAKLIGFYGFVGDNLSSIGIYTFNYSSTVMPSEKVSKMDPPSVVRGQSWTLGPFDSSFHLLRITIWHENVIHGIQFKYELNGREQRSLVYGAIKGKSDKIALDHQLDLSEIEVSTNEENQIVSSLSFVTKNNRTFGPYGQVTENKYSIPAPTKLAGFHGFAGDNLCSIGIFTFSSAVSTDFFSKMGPSGGEIGQSWTLGPFNSTFRLLRIKVWHDDVIHGIQFKYELNGGEGWGPVHGVVKGRCDKIVFDHQHCLAEIEVCTKENPIIVSSLSFVNEVNRNFGPHGQVTETKYNIPVQGTLVGFHGFAGDNLSSIGVYIIS